MPLKSTIRKKKKKRLLDGGFDTSLIAMDLFSGLANLEEQGIHFDEINRIRFLDEISRNQVCCV